MQSVLALLKGRRVSLDEAWRVLSPKSSLIMSGVRILYAMTCMSIHDKRQGREMKLHNVTTTLLSCLNR
jgi:hypothetical protein